MYLIAKILYCFPFDPLSHRKLINRHAPPPSFPRPTNNLRFKFPFFFKYFLSNLIDIMRGACNTYIYTACHWPLLHLSIKHFAYFFFSICCDFLLLLELLALLMALLSFKYIIERTHLNKLNSNVITARLYATNNKPRWLQSPLFCRSNFILSDYVYVFKNQIHSFVHHAKKKKKQQWNRKSK